MTKEIVLNLVLDRCPGCQGVWLDGGELELLREGLERGMAADFARAIVPPF
jgi:Zn-finger nucleic acid-binding protein